MHLLGWLSLGCSLAAATLVLLGAREPATAAAYESGQGYDEEEPEPREAKVSQRPGESFGIARGPEAAAPPSSSPRASCDRIT